MIEESTPSEPQFLSVEWDDEGSGLPGIMNKFTGKMKRQSLKNRHYKVMAVLNFIAHWQIMGRLGLQVNQEWTSDNTGSQLSTHQRQSWHTEGVFNTHDT